MNWQHLMVLIQYVVSHSQAQVNQNYHNADSTWWVPAGLNKPKTPLALENWHTVICGVVYYIVNSKDVHFNLLCVFVWVELLPAPHLHNQLTPPLPPLTTELCYCCLRLTFYSLTFWGKFANGFFIWLLPCKISLKLRYRFDFSKKKSFYMYIILH